jgi:hypothetical protein
MVETLGIAVGKELIFRPGDWSITACSARCNRTLEFRDDLRKLTHLDLVKEEAGEVEKFLKAGHWSRNQWPVIENNVD